MKVYTRLIEGHRVLIYSYTAEGVAFRFHLLCEVGQPYVEAAVRKSGDLAKRTASRVIQVELKARPWYVDSLVKESK